MLHLQLQRFALCLMLPEQGLAVPLQCNVAGCSYFCNGLTGWSKQMFQGCNKAPGKQYKSGFS